MHGICVRRWSLQLNAEFVGAEVEPAESEEARGEGGVGGAICLAEVLTAKGIWAN